MKQDKIVQAAYDALDVLTTDLVGGWLNTGNYTSEIDKQGIDHVAADIIADYDYEIKAIKQALELLKSLL